MCIIVCLGTEWVDPEDPTVIAETELLGAAASIEAAAKKLEQLKPRAKPRVMHMLNALFKDYSTLVCCKGTVLLIYINIYVINRIPAKSLEYFRFFERSLYSPRLVL